MTAILTNTRRPQPWTRPVESATWYDESQAKEEEEDVLSHLAGISTDEIRQGVKFAKQTQSS